MYYIQEIPFEAGRLNGALFLCVLVEKPGNLAKTPRIHWDLGDVADLRCRFETLSLHGFSSQSCSRLRAGSDTMGMMSGSDNDARRK